MCAVCTIYAKLRKDACSFVLGSCASVVYAAYLSAISCPSCSLHCTTLAVVFKRDGPAGAAVPLTDLIQATNGATSQQTFFPPRLASGVPRDAIRSFLHKRPKVEPLKGPHADVDCRHRKSTNAVFPFSRKKKKRRTHASFSVKNYTAPNTE